jgi:ribosome biogenesis GTPase A
MADIQYYPGHMDKTRREILNRLKLIDIVFEVVDARAPLSTQHPDITSIVKDKPRLIILNKADLADQAVLEKFEAHFTKQGYSVVQVDSLKGTNVREIRPMAEKLLEEKFAKEKKRGREKRAIRALILGIPNVGKSTLINRLVDKRVTKVGDRPGITRHLQSIRAHKNLELLDTPGVLPPKISPKERALKLALLGAIKDHLVPRDEVVIFGFQVLTHYYRDAFEKRYDFKIEDEDPVKIFEAIGRRIGALKKGGFVDYDKVMDRFLHDFRHQQFGPVILERPNEDV